MPSRSGKDSWENLGDITYGIAGSGTSDYNAFGYFGYNKANKWPLNYMRTGSHYWWGGDTSGRTTGGYWWNMTSGSYYFDRPQSNVLTVGLNGDGEPDVVYSYSFWRGYGYAIRCVVRS